jgi:hypothetical protein
MSRLLEKHGTKAFSMPPGAIVSAAIADLRLRDAKRGAGVSHKHGEQVELQLQAQHYAFHRRHVARAKDAKSLVSLAIKQRKLGLKSGKKNTRLIYRDAKLLKSALKAAGERK